MKLWGYFVIFEGAAGHVSGETGETLAPSKESAEGNVREYYARFGQISSVTIRKIGRN